MKGNTLQPKLPVNPKLGLPVEIAHWLLSQGRMLVWMKSQREWSTLSLVLQNIITLLCCTGLGSTSVFRGLRTGRGEQ